MKKSILFYLTVLTSIITLQSCVTNYVVAEPALYTKEYKSNAKVSPVEVKRLEQNKQILINSFTSEKTAKMAIVNNLEKKAEVIRAIKLSKTIDGILEEAATYLGTPYRYGGMTRKGIDCSAFVLSVFGSAAGINLPRVAASQAQEGERVEKSNLQKGDLVFFSQGGGRISHVGIVENVTEEGEIKFIHAATSRGVMTSSLNDKYWGPKYRFAKRIVTPDLVAGEANFAERMN
ncbi:MAG: C40 family peptidase [Weeksellaceae bacterium]|nr:C40 family peptidase [Weeksellaceae bacterium]